MNTSASSAGVSTFAQGSSEVGFPLGGAVLLILLLVGAAVLVIWARYRRGAGWQPPWAAVQVSGRTGRNVEPPRLISSVRLDAVHRIYAIAWSDRQFLIATGVNTSPVLIASVANGDGTDTPPSRG